MDDNKNKTPLISLVILTWNKKDLLKTCLSSFQQFTNYPNYEIIVVDNGGTDGSDVLVTEKFPKAKLVKIKINQGFAGGMNEGIKASNGDYVCLISNDIEAIDKEWLNNSYQLMSSKQDIGILGYSLLYPNGDTQKTGGWLKQSGLTDSYVKPLNLVDKPTSVHFVSGAILLIKREVFDAIGLLDKGFFPYCSEETDFEFRARKKGFDVIYHPHIQFSHGRGQTLKSEAQLKLFYVTHKNILRFKLLNYPLSWLIKSPFYEFKPFVNIFLEKKDKKKHLKLSNLQLRKHIPQRLIQYIKLYWTNLKNLPEILDKRKNRKAKLWY